MWSAKDLRTAKFANGDSIPNVTDDEAWTQLAVSATSAWCNYENSIGNDDIFGKLYNWYTVSDPRNICPTGWHVPTDAEWEVLFDYLGGPAVGGGKMKSVSGWNPPNTAATNESRFSGLPGGVRAYSSGVFQDLGDDGYWWSSSESGIFNAWIRSLRNFSGSEYRSAPNLPNGYSVRCLKD